MLQQELLDFTATLATKDGLGEVSPGRAAVEAGLSLLTGYRRVVGRDTFIAALAVKSRSSSSRAVFSSIRRAGAAQHGLDGDFHASCALADDPLHLVAEPLGAHGGCVHDLGPDSVVTEVSARPSGGSLPESATDGRLHDFWPKITWTASSSLVDEGRRLLREGHEWDSTGAAGVISYPSHFGVAAPLGRQQ